MQLRNRVIHLTGLFVLLMALLGGLNFWALHWTVTETVQIVEQRSTAVLISLARVRAASAEMGDRLTGYAFLQDNMAPAFSLDYQAAYDSLQAELLSLRSPDMRFYSQELQGEMERSAAGLYQAGTELFSAQPGDVDAAWQKWETARGSFYVLIDAASTAQIEEIQQRIEIIQTRARNLFWLYGISVLLVILLVIRIASRFCKDFVQRVNAINQMVSGIGAGHWQVRVADKTQDELGQLARTINQTTDELFEARQNLQRTTAELAMQLAERQKAETMLSEAAAHDPLTGLPNSTVFFEQLNHAIALATRNANHLGVLFIDMDGLKAVNDAFGHDGGDILIREVARRLREHVRESDYVARLAGDEFVVILENLQDVEQDLNMICAKLVAALAEPYEIRGRRLRLTASIGASFFPEHGRDADELLRNADSAMYRVKNRGKNNYVVYQLS